MQINGKIESCEVGKSGTKKDGSEYTQYKYKISGRYYSGFGSLDEFDVKIGDSVILSYTEKENPSFPDKPYKNIVNITQAKDKGVEESNKQYNVKPVGETPTPPKVDFQEALQERITRGMVFNKTVDWIIAERALIGKGFTLDDNFDTIYEHLLKKVIEKSK